MKSKSNGHLSRGSKGGDSILPNVMRPQEGYDVPNNEYNCSPEGAETTAVSSSLRTSQRSMFETGIMRERHGFRGGSLLNNDGSPRKATSGLPDISKMMLSSANKRAERVASQLVLSSSRGLPVDIGLENLGNTCFMNSILQCLLHTDPFVEHFINRDIYCEINNASPTKGALAISFAQLVGEILKPAASGPGAVISPVNFQKAVGRYAPHLLDYQQQDCQEFMRFLLDGISEDLCRKSSPSDKTTKEITNDCKNEKDNAKLSGVPTKASVLSPKTPTPVEDSAALSPGPGPGPGITSSTLLNAHLNNSKSSSVLRLRAEVASASQGGVSLATSSFAVNSSSNNNTLGAVTGTNQDHVRTIHVKSDRNSPNRNEVKSLILADGTSSIALPVLESVPHNLSTDEYAAAAAAANTKVVKVDHDRRESGDRTETISESNTAPVQSNSSISAGHQNQNGSPVVEESSASSALDSDRNRFTGVVMEAKKAWLAYLRLNDSIVTDIFAGLLQSTVECLTCRNRSYCFDPFLDLSVPIPKRTGNESRISSSWRRSSSATKCTLEDCLVKFTGEEVMDGDNMIKCEKCNTKRSCSKKLSVFRFPKVLVIHINRFRYNNVSREKLSTDVTFPLTGLDLRPYLSADRPDVNQNQLNGGLDFISPHQSHVYDLVGIANHIGNMNGGHYIAHINVNGGDGTAAVQQQRWMCFNDERVSAANTNSMCGPSAYVLFYRQREQQPLK